MAIVKVTGSFDDLQSSHIQFLEEASHYGPVHVLMWSDSLATRIEGKSPKFPESERQYFLDALRYVHQTKIVNDPVEREAILFDPVVPQAMPFPASPAIEPAEKGKKKVVVTGCYDWLHTGHVRFFEEVSQHGDVYAVVGHDANIALLKGAGHPQFAENQRRYVVGALKYVKQAIVSTGNGWLDAEPEIAQIKPDIYAVNEDGDKPEKRDFCAARGIEYLVFKRLPKPGLPARSSTQLRGF